MKRAVFLDRDGVLNRSILIDGHPRPPATLEEVQILDGVVEAINILKIHDFVPVVVTNQPDVARGVISKLNVNKINTKIGRFTGIDFFYTCFHDDFDRCDCRKPSPGLIFRASKELNLDTPESFMVGDRWRDISAGQAAGCKSFFIDYLYPEPGPKRPFTAVKSLLEAVKIILGEQNGTS